MPFRLFSQKASPKGKSTAGEVKVITVKEALTRWLTEEQQEGVELEELLTSNLLPDLENRDIQSITRSEIEAIYNNLGGATETGSVFLKNVTKLFHYTEDQGLRPKGTNPCVYIGKFDR